MHKPRRRSVTIAAVAVLFLSGSGVAFAYWTNSGSGTGTASTGTNAAVTVNQTSTIIGMYPGDTAQTLSGDFTSPNLGPTWVTAVTATGYTIDATHVEAGCIDTDGHYTLGGTATVGANVPAGTNKGSWTGLTIHMNNLASNQDFCKGATVTITYASS